jgi:hypothetical protein
MVGRPVRIGGKCSATHASNALNKWLKEEFEGMTAHSCRHSKRDRLRSVECPLDMIDQISGWNRLTVSEIVMGKATVC